MISLKNNIASNYTIRKLLKFVVLSNVLILRSLYLSLNNPTRFLYTWLYGIWVFITCKPIQTDTICYMGMNEWSKVSLDHHNCYLWWSCLGGPERLQVWQQCHRSSQWASEWCGHWELVGWWTSGLDLAEAPGTWCTEPPDSNLPAHNPALPHLLMDLSAILPTEMKVKLRILTFKEYSHCFDHLNAQILNHWMS